MFSRDTQFIYLLPRLMSYAVPFELEYITQFLYPQAFDIACNMQSSQFVPDVSFSSDCRYTRIEKLFMKSENVCTFVTEQSKKSSGGHEPGLVHLYDATFFWCNEKGL